MGAVASKAVSTARSTSLKQCTLWKANRSPACRAVMMTLDAINLNITEIDVNLDQGEHKCGEISILNPFQTLPILRDSELVLYDSNAICCYLASRYCESGSMSRLYPKDAGARALVHQQLFYNCSVLHPRYRNAADPILYQNSNFVMPQQVCEIECSYADLERILERKSWFGGSWPTLGDINFGATLSTLNYLVPINSKRYPVLSTWLCKLSKEYYYVTANRKGLCEFVKRIGELTPLQQL